MKHTVLPLFTALLLAPLSAVPVATPNRPNFVFILGEGHGWSSASVQTDDAVSESKSAFVRTPNLEKLAQSGMRFANFYAPSPRCTPSRPSLLTSKSPGECRSSFAGRAFRQALARMSARLAKTCFPPLPRWRMSASRCQKGVLRESWGLVLATW
jgi:hypothetical protein